MPNSDPLADGSVIQESGAKALANGMSVDILFRQLLDMRKNIHLPVILMGYLNPVLQYGFERFCHQAAAAGIDGLIIPDLPMHEFENQYGAILKQYELDFIFLVTPETSEARVRKADSLSSGFLYAVSSSSLTGSDKDFTGLAPYLNRLQSYHLQNPVLVGFGIKDKASFEAAASLSQGAIVGSAYIQALNKGNDIATTTRQFIEGIIGKKS